MYTQIGAELAGGGHITVHQTSESSTVEAPFASAGQQIIVGWKISDGQVLLQ
jgi:hypothetical protein